MNKMIFQIGTIHLLLAVATSVNAASMKGQAELVYNSANYESQKQAVVEAATYDAVREHILFANTQHLVNDYVYETPTLIKPVLKSVDVKSLIKTTCDGKTCLLANVEVQIDAGKTEQKLSRYNEKLLQANKLLSMSNSDYILLTKYIDQNKDKYRAVKRRILESINVDRAASFGSQYTERLRQYNEILQKKSDPDVMFINKYNRRVLELANEDRKNNPLIFDKLRHIASERYDGMKFYLSSYKELDFDSGNLKLKTLASNVGNKHLSTTSRTSTLKSDINNIINDKRISIKEVPLLGRYHDTLTDTYVNTEAIYLCIPYWSEQVKSYRGQKYLKMRPIVKVQTDRADIVFDPNINNQHSEYYNSLPIDNYCVIDTMLLSIYSNVDNDKTSNISVSVIESL